MFIQNNNLRLAANGTTVGTQPTNGWKISISGFTTAATIVSPLYFSDWNNGGSGTVSVLTNDFDEDSKAYIQICAPGHTPLSDYPFYNITVVKTDTDPTGVTDPLVITSVEISTF